MTILEGVVLGVLQGLTEFLPVSSSGHLVLMQYFLGLNEPQVFIDVMLHLGTLGAVVIVYYESIRKLVGAGISAVANPVFYRRPVYSVNHSSDLKLIWFILLGSIPAGIIIILFADQLESLFDNPTIVAVMLITTGIILQLPRLRGDVGERGRSLRFWHAPLIGIAQAFAIVPGISRAGSTISLALLLGLSPRAAARYSFLLSIPAIIGAVVLKFKEVTEITIVPISLVFGMLASFVVGYFALRVLLSVVNRGQFSGFSYYCFALGATVLIIEPML